MSFSVRTASVSDSAGIRELFGKVFPRAMSEEEWRWKYPSNPDGWISVVAERDGKIVGHYGGWLMGAWIGGRPTTIVSLGDVATDPAARHLGGRRNVFRSIAQAMFEVLESRGVPFGFGFPSPRAYEIGRRLLGYRAHFGIREVWLDVSAPGRSSGLAAASDSVGAGFDALWSRARTWVDAACLVRDRARANWRYHARPDRYYRMVTIPGEAGDRAWGALSAVGETALVVDYLLEGPDPGLAETFLGDLGAEARAMGCRNLVFWQPPGGAAWGTMQAAIDRRAWPRQLRDAGFSFVTAVVFDEETLQAFVRDAHLAAGVYDDR